MANTETAETGTSTDETTATVDETTDTGEATKADVPPEVKRALQKANKEAETLRLKLKEFEDRDKTDAQKLEERLAAAEARNAELEIDNLRRDVAADKGLTPAQARRLVGTTRDELEADADDLLKALPSAGTTSQYGDVGQGHRGGSTAGDPRDIFASFIQRRT